MLIRILTGCFKGLLELVAWLFLLAGIPIGIFFTVLSSKVGELIQGWFPSFPAEYVTATVLLLSVMLAVVWAIVAFIVSVFTFPPLTILFSIDSRLNDISKKNPILENSDLSDEDIYTISVDGPPVKKPVVIGALVGITFVGCGIAIASGKGTQIEPNVVHRDSYGVMTDSRDGQTYRTVTIGSQTWMAENLNYETKDSHCYKNKSTNCKMYGRFYVWDAAQKACPVGWHLPSKKDFEILIKTVGGEDNAGKMLKSTYGWHENHDGTDDFGFNALPTGGYFGNEDGWSFLGSGASFWSSTENEDFSGSSFYLSLYYLYDKANINSIGKNLWLSVRCIED